MAEILAHQICPPAAVMEKRLVEELSRLNLSLDDRTSARLAAYHALLADWNTRMNLTGDTDFETSISRHYLDCLAPLAVEGAFPQGASLIDVGSGAGFPGLPLAIARPDLQVLLLDSLMKRVQFLSAVVEELQLTNVRIRHARAEDAGREPILREQFDMAVARAVAPLPVLCELLLPFVKVGGHMACYKGPAAQEELAAAQKASRLLGGGDIQVAPVVIPTQPDWQHTLVLCPKSQKTVRQYPRKAGTPARQPLGGFVKG